MSNPKIHPRILSALLLSLLLIGGGLFLFFKPAARNSKTGEDRVRKADPVPTLPLAIPDVLDEHWKILRAEFPGYVLPLERDRLGKRLTHAIEINDETEVLRLLNEGADANWTGVNSLWHSDTRAPLFLAIKRGNPNVVEALLKRGARVGGVTNEEIIACRNQWSQTPLYFAVRCGNKQIIELLLQHGALIGASNGYGKTPIVAAVEEGNLPLFEYLLSKGAVCDFEASFSSDRRPGSHVLFDYSPEYFVPPFDDQCDQVNSSLIGLAELSGNHDLVTAVVAQFESSPGFGPNLQAESAVRRGDAEALRRLLADGYDPTWYDPAYTHGNNLLDLAEAAGHTDVFDVLAKAGVKRQLVKTKKNVLHLVVETGSVEKLEELLEAGATLEPVEVRGRGQHGKMTEASPLKLAVRAQREEMVDFLLQRAEAQDGWLTDPYLLLNALPFYRNDERPYSEKICKALIEAGTSIGFDSTEVTDRDRNPLILAARAGWIDVYKMLENRAPNRGNRDAALQAAVLGNHSEMCRYLVASGADPDYREQAYPVTALEHAMSRRNRELLEEFVKAGAKRAYPEQHDVSTGYNHFEQYAHPLYHAALVGDAEFCEFLIQQFPPGLVWQALKYEPYEYDNDIRYFDKGNTPLFAPVFGDHADAMKLLLTYGLQKDKDGQSRVDINATNQNGATALHEAVNFGADKCVQLLLAAGADPTIQEVGEASGAGDTPLHLTMDWPYAAPGGPPTAADIFPMLVAAGMNGKNPDWLNRKNARGMTPLHSHARAANTEICLKLISLGADVNATTDHGHTPLASAIVGAGDLRLSNKPARKRRSDLCIKFVQGGAKFDQPIESYQTSYYALAYRQGLFEFCEYLLGKGVSPYVKLNAGEYLCSAVKYKRADLVEELIAAGADVNAQDSRKNTALQWAVLVRDVEFCKMLLKSGADPNIAGEDGHTPLISVFDRFLNHVKRFNTPKPRETQQEAIALLRVLLEAGADPQVANEQNLTVLQAYSNMPAEFRKLIEASIK